MTIPNDLARCAGNGTPQCTECRRRVAGNAYSPNMVPPPGKGECHQRIVPIDVVLRELQGRGD